MSKSQYFVFTFFLFIGIIFYSDLKSLDIVEEMSLDVRGKTVKIGDKPYSIQEYSKGAHITYVFEIEGMKYFVKETIIRTALNSVIGGRLLRNIPNNFERRFPEITIGIDNSEEMKFYLISRKLSDFESLAKIDKSLNPFYIQDDNSRRLVSQDLSNLYVALFLMGGGDVSDVNLFYSTHLHVFGFIDFDIAFQKHFNVKRIEHQVIKWIESGGQATTLDPGYSVVQYNSEAFPVLAISDRDGFIAFVHPIFGKIFIVDSEGNEAFLDDRKKIKIEDGKGQICYTRDTLALREFQCDNPLGNFLFLTHSGIRDYDEKGLAETLIGFNFKEASNRGELYTAHQILEAMQLVTDKILDEYLSVITHSISDIRFKYKDFTEEDIDESLVLEKHKKSFIEERYNFMKHLVTQYKKSECYSDKCSNDVLKEKLKVWCNEAYQLQETTTRTSSITLKEEL